MLVQSALSSLFARANEVGVAGTFQFVFSGQQHFWVRAPACTQVHAGMHSQADVTIAMDTSVFLAIMQGQSDIEALFAQGQLKIDGRLGLATLLPRLVSRALHGGDGERVEMDRRYPARPRFSEQLSARLDMRGGIERRTARQLSVHEFTTRYRAAGKPLVLSSALDDWPLAKMSMGQALEHFADVQGISRHGPTPTMRSLPSVSSRPPGWWISSPGWKRRVGRPVTNPLCTWETIRYRSNGFN